METYELPLVFLHREKKSGGLVLGALVRELCVGGHC